MHPFILHALFHSVYLQTNYQSAPELETNNVTRLLSLITCDKQTFSHPHGYCTVSHFLRPPSISHPRGHSNIALLSSQIFPQALGVTETRNMVGVLPDSQPHI